MKLKSCITIIVYIIKTLKKMYFYLILCKENILKSHTFTKKIILYSDKRITLYIRSVIHNS